MYYAGKLSGRVESQGVDLLNIRVGFVGIEKKVENNRRESFSDFITRVECSGTQETWETKVESLSAQRDLRDEQNAHEHEELRMMVSETNKKLDEIFKCLHKLDKRIPDEKRTG